jgi:site-specific DNA-methyltransferase (adenine-specific)
MGEWVVFQGDCIDSMKEMEDSSIDSIVCDPPYAIEFMSHAWDSHGDGLTFQEWCTEWGKEALRVLKPGGHMLAFGGTRTFHRLISGIEDAGFEIRDCLMWVHGQGFPKSKNVALAIDKKEGGPNRGRAIPTASTHLPNGKYKQGGEKLTGNRVGPYEPQTEDAKKWNGWGTALKPSWEPIVVARKPLMGTVAANVVAHGTGAINIDECRIGNETIRINRLEQWSGFGQIVRPDYETTEVTGRWPANVALTHNEDCEDECTAGCPIALMDLQSGDVGNGWKTNYGEKYAEQGLQYGGGSFGGGGFKGNSTYADSGGASRFFFCAKATKKEKGADNDHPTVKPIRLMQWLVRLVTPPDGIVLDLFMGSGTTGVAAIMEGYNFVGCEMDDHYINISERRMQEAEDAKE